MTKYSIYVKDMKIIIRGLLLYIGIECIKNLTIMEFRRKPIKFLACHEIK